MRKQTKIDLKQFNVQRDDGASPVARITVHTDGQIVDGHMRYAVWNELRDAPPLFITLIDDAGKRVRMTLTRKDTKPCVP